MGTQLIEYTYAGDERPWREAIETFLTNIRDDPALSGGISYAVFVREDGKTRVHVPVWRDQATLERLQAQPFFKDFSTSVKGFAAGTLKTSKPVLAS
jgi:quinol monooxygenase YgiN